MPALLSSATSPTRAAPGRLHDPGPEPAARGTGAPEADRRPRRLGPGPVAGGLLIGAAAWALGAHSQNYQQSYSGRKAVLVSGFAALLIGAGPAIVNFFFATGQGVH